MKIKFVGLFIHLLFIINVVGCSYIKDFFPDKRLQYQLTTEIPELQIPPDLSAENIQADTTQQINKGDNTDNTRSGSTANSAQSKADKNDAIYVDLLEYSGGATRIRIEDSIERTWRTVGKALSRQSIEIIDRNEQEKVYFIQYDPDFKKVKDGSLWDEVKFIFGSDPAKEKEYRVKLSENGSLTEIIVMDTNNRPLSTGPGLKLLNLLYNTIKQDLTK